MLATKRGLATLYVHQAVEAFTTGDRAAAAVALDRLAQVLPEAPGDEAYPPEFVRRLATAVRTDDWSAVGEAFAAQQFIAPDGSFLLLGPLTQRRGGRATTVPSAISGRVLHRFDSARMAESIVAEFGELREPVPTMLPVDVHAAGGAVGGEAGEAFVVPDAWGFPHGESGPSLNDMAEQRRRFGDAGCEAIHRIFEPTSAALLLAPFADDRTGDHVRASEYASHEAGHAAGLGLGRKLRDDLLATPQLRGVEEWRADGVSFSLSRFYSTEEAAQALVASNFATRFGVDAHRRGGVEADIDVTAGLLTFGALVEGGALVVGRTGRLAFTRPDGRGLWQATELHRASAVALTRKELRLTQGVGIGHLYSIGVPAAVVQLFHDKVVAPAAALYVDLR